MTSRRASIVAAVFLALAKPAAAACTGSRPVWTATPDAKSVQRCVNRASNGDTVRILPGTATWTTTVEITRRKNVSVIGAGAGQTTIIDNLASGPILEISAAPGRVVRISGFTIDVNGVQKGPGAQSSVLVTGTGPNSFRIDHLDMRNIRGRAILVEWDARFGSGLIDHTTFQCPFDAGCQSVAIIGGGPRISNQMSRPYAPGSDQFVYVEDCTFNYAYQNDGGVEGYGGAWYVLRRSTLHGVTQGHHGADSGNYRGTQAFEIYENTFDWQGSREASHKRSHTFRSGVGFVWGNTYSREYGALNLDNYRSRGAYGVWGACNGKERLDGNQNTTTGSGWPCLDQIGHQFSDKLDGRSIVEPLYVFNLRKAGALYAPTVFRGGHVADDIVINRDYYVETIPFDGTAGIGIGPLADRPVKCTPDVGYWASDEGEWDSTHAGPDGRFYRCTAPDTWTLTYTPYTYPHPLTR